MSSSVKNIIKKAKANQAKAWEKLMKETDNGDGNLTYNEFADGVKYQKKRRAFPGQNATRKNTTESKFSLVKDL